MHGRINEPSSLFEALLSSFENIGWDKGILILKLRKDWNRIVGDYLSRHCFPIRIREETLIVGVSNHMLLQQLSFERARLEENLKRRGFNLKVKLVLEAKSKKTSRTPMGKLSSKEIEQIERATAHIKDDSLREGLKRAIIALEKRRRGMIK